MKKLLFNENVVNLKPSASLAFMMKAKQMKAQGMDVVDLAGGEPDFATSMSIVEEAYRQMAAGNTHYAVGQGIPELLERLQKKFLEENNITYQTNEILVTPGGKYAIYLTVNTLLNPGEEVMYLEPAWVSYVPIIEAAGAKAVPVVLSYEEDYKITLEALEARVSEKTKLLIINYPNNPTGKTLSEQEAKVIECFMLAHPDVFLLSDEIYERLIFDGTKHISPASMESIHNRVITANGFSKSLAMTGWRLGYLAAPRYIMEPVYKLYQHSVSCVSGFLQKAAVTALDCQEEIEEMRQAYQNRRDIFTGMLQEIRGVKVRPAEGAFYAWVRFEKEGIDPADMGSFILNQARVVGVPGEAFGEGGKGCMRFSFANDLDNLEKAALRIKAAMEAQRCS